MAELKDFLKSLGDRIKTPLAEETAIEAIVAALEGKDTEIATLKPLAEDGKAYRSAVLADTIRFGVILGEIPTDDEGQKKQADFLGTWPMGHLRDLRDRYEKRARETYPETFTIPGKDEKDRNDKTPNPAEEMEAAVRDKMSKTPGLAYTAALLAVQTENPELARRYAEAHTTPRG